MKHFPTLVRDQHPMLETFERVLSRGVMVERGPADRRRSLWESSSIGGVALLESEESEPGYRLFGENAFFDRRDSGDYDDD
jgi:hypothetical protein